MTRERTSRAGEGERLNERRAWAALLIGAATLSLPVVASSTSDEPPHIVTSDGIAASNEALDAGRDEAGVRLAGTTGPGTEVANVLLRLEGQGEFLPTYMAQQTVFVYDNSGSMDTSDPDGLRCDAMKRYADRMGKYSELAAVEFDSSAFLVHRLTTDFAAVKSSLRCEARGGTDILEAVRVANNELLPKLRGGYAHVEILLTDGAGTDPTEEVERAARGNVRLFTVCLLQCDGASMRRWAEITGGRSFRVTDPGELDRVYDEISELVDKEAVAGLPPPGAPMLTLQVEGDIEVLEGSFSIRPSRPEVEVGNRGLLLEWDRPAPRMRVGERLDLTFSVRAHRAGEDIPVNDPLLSSLAYVTFQGDPAGGGFPALRLDVWSPEKDEKPTPAPVPPPFRLPELNLDTLHVAAVLVPIAVLVGLGALVLLLRRRRKSALDEAVRRESDSRHDARRGRAARIIAAGRRAR